MRIAVNTRFVIPGKLEGIGWFSREASWRMAQAHPEHRFLFLFDRTVPSAFAEGENVEGIQVPPPARHPWLWRAWFEYSIPRVLKRHRADAFISLDGFCSVRSRVPTYMVVHDLAFEHFSEHVPSRVLRYYRHWSPRYAQRAQRLGAVSAATRDDIVARYGIPPERIDVLGNGAHDRYKPLDAAGRSAARERFARGHPYAIYVGSLHPRKNLERLFRAFDRAAGQTPDLDLVVAGRMAWQSGPIQAAYEGMKHRDRVHLTGHLEPEALADALGGAEALIYPSLFEGFGIPIVEAFACDVPVLTSTVSSMPEVAGDAALLVDPTDEAALAEGILRLHREPELREALVAKGRVRRQAYSWEKTAERLWDGVQRMLDEQGLGRD